LLKAASGINNSAVGLSVLNVLTAEMKFEACYKIVDMNKGGSKVHIMRKSIIMIMMMTMMIIILIIIQKFMYRDKMNVEPEM